jgi:CMP-N-acetylneuraminic acid synthetase
MREEESIDIDTELDFKLAELVLEEEATQRGTRQCPLSE